MVVIGGGVIGLELGSVWRRLGAKVTVVEFLDQILPGMDGEVRKEAREDLQEAGLRDPHLDQGHRRQGRQEGRHAHRRARRGRRGRDDRGGCGARLDRPPAEHRRPRSSTRPASPSTKRGQIETDHEFRTSVPGIWAIGDVIPGPMLAHKAEDEGIAVAENIAGLTGIVNHEVIPSVVYTMPEIAGVGLTEEDAKAAGHEVKTGKFPMMANSRAKTNREGDGFVKVIADAKTDRVLGVWIIASVGGTMIAQAAQAMEFGATSEDIAYTCHAHPTHSEAIKEAAMAVTGQADPHLGRRWMSKFRSFAAMAAALMAAAPVLAQDADRPDTIIGVESGDPEMNAAIARAVAELPDFFRHLASPGAGEQRFLIKFDIIPGDEAEFVWASDLDRSSTPMTGTLLNQPEWIDGFEIGQRVVIPDDRIIDWSYFRGRVLQGAHTQRVLLGRMPPEDAARLRADAGW